MTPEFSIGLGKTIFNSSVALLPSGNFQDAEIILSERLNRVKNSGAWPESALRAIMPRLQGKTFQISDNRDVQTVNDFENYYDSRMPFSDRLKSRGLEIFMTSGAVKTIPHHLAHAYGVVLFSPFSRCLILVIDGAGSPDKDEKKYEYLSLYIWEKGCLTLLDKKLLEFIPSKIPGQTFSEGIGIFYEKTSEYIFNSKTEAGKVMGLAPFGKSLGAKQSYTEFLSSLDWSKQFKGKSKKEWEISPNMDVYRNLAATVQENFEIFLMNYINEIKARWPSEEHIILTGGCALNCTFNGKLYKKKIFKNIFIPPNPGDESIGLGCAFGALEESQRVLSWQPTDWELLTSSRGLKASVPSGHEIEATFSDWKLEKPANLPFAAAQILSEGKILAWFQDRSEIGPRALGNRSILASPTRNDLKNYLNEFIKFRENFRPYGCTVQWEKSHLFFEVEEGFENPFMSFSVPVKSQFQSALKDLSHVDGTSRMQTLHFEQSPLLHRLLGEMEKINGFPIVLNTSLNVMNEPILENILDARRFMENSLVDALVIQNYIVRKK